MKSVVPRISSFLGVLLLLLALIPTLRAENQVMGEIQFEGKSHVEKTSGVWIDGQYVGYLKELKGSKKVLLLPGEHTIRISPSAWSSSRDKSRRFA